MLNHYKIKCNLGAPEQVSISLLDPRSVVYVPSLLQYIDVYGNVFDGSLVSSSTMTTSTLVTADNPIFYIKVILLKLSTCNMFKRK